MADEGCIGISKLRMPKVYICLVLDEFRESVLIITIKPISACRSRASEKARLREKVRVNVDCLIFYSQCFTYFHRDLEPIIIIEQRPANARNYWYTLENSANVSEIAINAWIDSRSNAALIIWLVALAHACICCILMCILVVVNNILVSSHRIAELISYAHYRSTKSNKSRAWLFFHRQKLGLFSWPNTFPTWDGIFSLERNFIRKGAFWEEFEERNRLCWSIGWLYTEDTRMDHLEYHDRFVVTR